MLHFEDEDFFSELGGVLTFFSCYIYAISVYGLLLGGGLGWIPSLIIGVVVYFFIEIFGKFILNAIIVLVVIALILRYTGLYK